MQGWFRLATWGAAAAAALVLVAVAANSSGGQQRMSTTFVGANAERAAEAAKAEAAQAALTAQLARIAATEADTRRLVEMVRSLATDRERLMARVAALERSLEDVTGSIQKQAAVAPPPAAAPTGPPPATAAAPQTIPAAEPAASAGAPTPAPPTRVANIAPPGSPPELEAIETRPAAGVDVGTARDFDGLRTLWNTLSSTHADLFEGLHPIVSVRENSKSRAAELRLVAGPLTDVESASRICTTLAAAKRYCRLVAFEGQPLALNTAAPRRQGAAVAKPRPVVRPAP
jgi:hypothetical protein